MYVIEGTWEEVKRHEAELSGRHVRLIVRSEKPLTRTTLKRTEKASALPSALGKYSFVGGGSDQFAAEKQAEIDREERQRG